MVKSIFALGFLGQKGGSFEVETKQLLRLSKREAWDKGAFWIEKTSYKNINHGKFTQIFSR
jgi:hypothetical protein